VQAKALLDVRCNVIVCIILGLSSLLSTAHDLLLQKRFAAKKDGRRSMTQPVTGDDVSAAAELIREQR